MAFTTKPTTAGSLTAGRDDRQGQQQRHRRPSRDRDAGGDRQHGLRCAASAATFTIKGFGFDPTAAHDTVVFNDGAVGTVATAKSTALTVTFSTDPTTAGSLTAIVTIDDESSGAPVQVATVTPVVTASTASLPANASQITINGSGFDPTAANNKVTFNDGAAGTVTTASRDFAHQ